MIIGAGLGGLAAAVALQKSGHKVTVYERTPELGELGAGIMLTPNAVRALEHIAALDSVMEFAVEPERSYSRHYATGEIMGERSVSAAYLEKYGKPMLTIHRADLHRALARVVRANDAQCIRLNHEFTSLTQDDRGVEAVFVNGTRERAELLIGADGIRSNVRLALGLSLPPRYTGLVAWRGLVPTESLPPRLRSTSTTSWIGSERHIIEYTVGHLKNYVAIARQANWRSESWTTPADMQEVLETYAGWHEDVMTMLRATPAGTLFKWALHDRDPLARWTYGRVTLLGDAAHAMLPLMAQGAAMALEDAAILARALDDSTDPLEALVRYENARRERTTWTQLQSRTAVDVYHRVDEGRWQHETEQRGKVLYSYDVASVTV